ncbi:MAG: pyridoxamine 5'-phosphate oxidase family protein [Pseudomonadota bacterium]
MRKDLTVNDLGDLLEQPVLAILATNRKDGTTLLSPVWQEWVNDAFHIAIWANDIKSKHIERDPRVSVVVAEQGAPFRGIEVSGTAKVSLLSDPMPMIQRLAVRYRGEAGLAYAEVYRGLEIELVTVAPGKLRAWDFADET